MNDLIINKGTVQAHLQVAEGVDKKNFKRFVYEAQYIDLRELMCESFYNDLVSKPGYCIGFGNDEKYSVLGYDIEQEDWENPGNLTSSKPGWEDGECETTSYFDSKELVYG